MSVQQGCVGVQVSAGRKEAEAKTADEIAMYGKNELVPCYEASLRTDGFVRRYAGCSWKLCRQDAGATQFESCCESLC
jgi:hypothetical protein